MPQPKKKEGVQRSKLKDGRTLEVNFSRPKPRPGSRFSTKDALVMGPELIRLCSQAGVDSPSKLSAKDVVDAARSERSPLHDYIFNLSDREAAEEFRLNIARKICREITFEMVFIDPEKEEKHIGQFFVHVDEGQSEGYHPLPEVLSSDHLREQMVQRALAELERWWERFGTILKLEEAGPHYEALKKKLSLGMAGAMR